MFLGDQVPRRSLVTAAISCTKFKIDSAHAESPMRETIFLLKRFREDQSLLYRQKKLGKRKNLVDQLPCGSVLTPAISCTKIYLAHAGHAKCLNKCLSVSSTFLFLLRHF